MDEGQDFRQEWLEMLILALHDSEQGIFYVFYDSNQNIYRRTRDLQNLLKIEPFTLTQNCRNTRAIHNVVKEFHPHPNKLFCYGPEGTPPELHFFSTDSQQKEIVQKTLDRLVNIEKVEPKHITLLTTRSPENTAFTPGQKLGNFVLMEWGTANPRSSDIRISSTHRFKGLENRVIILCGIEDNEISWLNEVLYVACSRARTYLVIVAHERSRSQLQNVLTLKK